MEEERGKFYVFIILHSLCWKSFEETNAHCAAWGKKKKFVFLRWNFFLYTSSSYSSTSTSPVLFFLWDILYESSSNIKFSILSTEKSSRQLSFALTKDSFCFWDLGAFKTKKSYEVKNEVRGKRKKVWMLEKKEISYRKQGVERCHFRSSKNEKTV